MLSGATTRSQKQVFSETKITGKSKSASTTLRQANKIPKEEKRVQSSPAESGTENKLSVQEILDRCRESDCGRVFEINLNGQALKQLPNLKEFPKLKILDLGCNKLKNVSPNDLEKNCELKELKLYANAITEISKGLQNVRKLKVLRLDNNHLSKIDYREIGCCSQLTVLDISCNDIQDISIQELDISRNRISNNLSGLKSLSNLTVLRAGNNDITSLNSLGKLRCLQELYLANNRISDIKSFPNQFSSLEILDLSNNMIENVDEMFVLSDISPLAELSVTGNPFHDKDEFSCHRQISQRLESLEFLDKVSLKRPSAGHSHAPPPMRPMSASQVVSKSVILNAFQVLRARQVEQQIRATLLEQESFEASITSRFSILRDLFESLPMELKTDPPDERPLSVLSRFDLESVSASRPSTAAEEDRPKSRCSSRSRIAEARAFAAEHFHSKQR
ncbi:Protein phosphatase 1 regulatory subunit 7 [Acropora cervicornis]|uniref:Protein phosphatase 1 regulatory subunit 7 n=1 Tax=Acropora cervicornis TaxID=6130 RepID=A0AAD9R234_ACRCE|nr:Protein phosphatase 1 regulatory subunit 7 [Acropora cervicornis]